MNGNTQTHLKLVSHVELGDETTPLSSARHGPSGTLAASGGVDYLYDWPRAVLALDEIMRWWLVPPIFFAPDF
jgi:hypothetical protein